MTPDDKIIVLTPFAQRNIDNMQKRVWDIERQCGDTSDATAAVRSTFARMLMTILQWGGRVYGEDELSLIIQSTMTIGIIWHPVREPDKDGILQPDPLLGTWSSHS